MERKVGKYIIIKAKGEKSFKKEGKIRRAGNIEMF